MFSGGPLHGPGAVLSRNLSGEPVSWIAVSFTDKETEMWKLHDAFGVKLLVSDKAGY